MGEFEAQTEMSVPSSSSSLDDSSLEEDSSPPLSCGFPVARDDETAAASCGFVLAAETGRDFPAVGKGSLQAATVGWDSVFLTSCFLGCIPDGCLPAGMGWELDLTSYNRENLESN